ncbi:MAG TPA: ComEC/Rec2 family competence protein, partial [Roseiflexaceae bacterium]|nr:ComEC/Rec2 family competence protein [Roseiflexaceae bacterium]
MNLIILAVAWLAGIIVADQAQLAWPVWAALLACAAAASVGMQRQRIAWQACLLMGCLAAGGLRMAIAEPLAGPRDIAQLAGTGDVHVVGVIMDDPQRSEQGQRALVAVEQVRRGETWVHAGGQALVKLPRFPEWRYGDRLEFAGRIDTPREAER